MGGSARQACVSEIISFAPGCENAANCRTPVCLSLGYLVKVPIVLALVFLTMRHFNKLSRISLGNGLRVLCWLRSVAILGYGTALALAAWWLSLPLPFLPMTLAIAALGGWNLMVLWRMRQPWPVGDFEVFLNLLVDIAVLTLLFYWSGGATNPFVSLYLIPIAIAAAALAYSYVAAVSVVCVACYSLLMRYYVALPTVGSAYGGDFNAHVIGMWINFLISAVLMALVVAGIAGAVRQRDRQLAKAREEALTSERIVAMGTLSAGVSHEISTPLSTMMLLVDELKARPGQEASVYEDLEMLESQIDACRERIKKLLDAAGSSRSESASAMRLSSFVDDLLDRWRVIRPEVDLRVSRQKPFDDPEILAEQTVAQSITNLLNNAADASVECGNVGVWVELYSREGVLEIRIDDQGRGVSEEARGLAGKAIFSTKSSGLGIGLMLSNASLGRLGGEVVLRSGAQGGTRTQVVLPLKQLIIEDVSDG